MSKARRKTQSENILYLAEAARSKGAKMQKLRKPWNTEHDETTGCNVMVEKSLGALVAVGPVLNCITM